MIWWRAGFAVLVGLGLFGLFRWLAAYSSETRNANSRLHWGIGLFGRSPDTTASAYARHVVEDAQALDAEAERLVALHPSTNAPFPEVTTEARTEQAPLLLP